MTKTTVLFSGRFDPPHIGHVITVARLASQFRRVLVYVLDYPEREYSMAYSLSVLREACAHMARVDICANSHHFGKISADDLRRYRFDVYASGNDSCLKHIAGLGKKTLFVERAAGVSATATRLGARVQQILE